MTDFQCVRCRRYARIYVHVRTARCSQCNEKMRRGRGRGTTVDV